MWKHLHSFNDQSNPRKWKKIVESGELNALCLLFVIAKIWPLGAEVIFLTKNFILENFQKLMRFQILLDQDTFMGKVWRKLIFRSETQWTGFRETLAYISVLNS